MPAQPKRKRSSLKRIRQNIRRRQRNQAWRSALRTLVKRARASGDAAVLREAQSALDRAAERGVIHENQAARRKARLARAAAKKTG